MPVGVTTSSSPGMLWSQRRSFPGSSVYQHNPRIGTGPLSVTFSDQSTNTPTSWRWAYRNATVGWTQFSTVQNPTFTFPPGTYDINLTATNAGGSDDELKSGYVVVSAPVVPPEAAFTNTTRGSAPDR